LMINGLILFASEWWKRRAPRAEASPSAALDEPVDVGAARWHRIDAGSAVESAVRTDHEAEIDATLSRLPLGRALLIGSTQIAALAPGISRSGTAMATGLWRGLSHEAAARFSFLLATPVILAA